MRIRTIVWLALGILTPLWPQASLGQLDGVCAYDGRTPTEEIFGFESDKEANEAVQKIVTYTGLQPNFLVKAANVPNAMAVIQGNQRLILYSQEFMMRVRKSTSTDWAAISIMAHEIGHHLQGHTLLAGGSRPSIELEADKYSGFVLYNMGATID